MEGRYTVTFKHGMTRKQELMLREELNGMTKRSLAELVVKKEDQKNATLTDSQKTMK